jgi:hypothetical protein
MYKIVSSLKRYDDSLEGSVVVNEMIVQRAPLCRPVHLMCAFPFQMEIIHVICCRLPHPFYNISCVLWYNYHKNSVIARLFRHLCQVIIMATANRKY